MLYALVHKNRVIAGPLVWTQKYFTDVLRVRHRISANIPGVAPSEFPFIIDENTAIYEAVDNQTPLDPFTQCYHGPHWDITSNPVVANYDVVDLDIVSARNNFKQVAAFERYKKEISGTKITLQGVEIQLSTQKGSKEPYIQKLLSMIDTDVCKWKFQNAWLDLTKDDLTTIIRAIDSHIQSTFDWEANIHSQLDAINVASELHSVKIVETTQESAGAE